MLHHVSIGVADVERAAQFYDAVLAKLGFKRVMEVMPYGIAYGLNDAAVLGAIAARPERARAAATARISRSTRTRKRAVNAFHAAALSAGGKDEGAPGPRPEYRPNYYGAFVRDLDGNKIEAVFFADETAKPQRRRRKPRKAKPAKKGGAEIRCEEVRKAQGQEARAQGRPQTVKQKVRRALSVAGRGRALLRLPRRGMGRAGI